MTLLLPISAIAITSAAIVTGSAGLTWLVMAFSAVAVATVIYGMVKP